jgi:hypothetical protein
MYLTSQQLIIPLLAVEHGLFTLSGAPEFTTILYWGPVSLIGGGYRITQRKPPACRKSMTNFIT